MVKKAGNLRLTHITTVPQSLAFLQGQLGFMQRRGFDIQAISAGGILLDQFGNREKVQTCAVEMERSISPIRDLRVVIQLLRAFRETRPTIVHAHTPKGGLLGMTSSFIARVPVRVYHMRGLPYMTANGWRRAVLKATERVSCVLAHRVICISGSLRDVAISDGVCPSGKIVVLGGGSGNGVDAEGRFNPQRFRGEEIGYKRNELGIPRDAPVVLFVGRLVHDKGIEELMQSWRNLRESFSDAYLVVVGPLETRDPISKESMLRLNEDPRVIMTGAVDDPAIYYALSDLLVLPTHREGFGNVNIEAASMEVPVVSTLIPGCVDSVEDGVTGTLVPPRDAIALEGVIRRYLEEPELRRRHGEAGRQRVLREFRQGVIWEAIYQEYCRLLGSKGLPIPTPEAPWA